MTQQDGVFDDRRSSPRRLGVGRRVLGNRRFELASICFIGVERRTGERRGRARRRVSAERRTVLA